MHVRYVCGTCNGTGKKVVTTGKYSFLTCLACGGTGYFERWLKIDDLADVLAWRAKRDVLPGGA